jgi:excisionase family DNA binding protein
MDDCLRAIIRDEVRQILREELRDLAMNSNPGTAPDAYLTVKAAAEVIAVSTNTIRNWLKAGTLRGYGTEGTVRIKRSDLDRMMATSRSPADVGPKVEDQVEAILSGRKKKVA